MNLDIKKQIGGKDSRLTPSLALELIYKHYKSSLPLGVRTTKNGVESLTVEEDLANIIVVDSGQNVIFLSDNNCTDYKVLQFNELSRTEQPLNFTDKVALIQGAKIIPIKLEHINIQGFSDNLTQEHLEYIKTEAINKLKALLEKKSTNATENKKDMERINKKVKLIQATYTIKELINISNMERTGNALHILREEFNKYLFNNAYTFNTKPVNENL